MAKLLGSSDTAKTAAITPKENVTMTTSAAPATPAKTTSAKLVFTDLAELPGADVLAVNPYQDKVNELARTGRAASIRVHEDKVDSERNSIRRAANSINKGAKTKVSQPDDENMVTIYFKIGDKRDKKS